jgi:hypothetical protein
MQTDFGQQRQEISEELPNIFKAITSRAAVLRVFMAAVPLQIVSFPQDLTVEQPRGCAEIDQENPIGKNQELAKPDDAKGQINGIASEGYHAGRYQLVWMDSIDAHSKAVTE